ncbi:MAG TPA: fructose-specific PTS transporter subunit EIIC [Nocardioides sp.]|uniref:PTS fructose transporter subunit IIABC n=1 Tax=Nocardioides sp. TaxID=35761 RepID=UPI002CB12A23|nr:fructose-specific PTS transporter subunit EIIC [Nocardioides sp.]HQR26719.1 fructose-specific PTS transporter subunit EIIC [Nocardioides sp.]
MTDMITPDLVRLDADLGGDKPAVIESLAGIVASAGRTTRADLLVADTMAREETSPTGLPGGIAIPHCRTAAVEVPTLAFARLSPTVEFGAKDGPADLAFLIAAPAGGDATHLKVLTQLARALVKKEFTDGLRAARTPEEVVALVNSVVSVEPAGARVAAAATVAAPAAAAPAETRGAAARRTIVAVTACPTGIAHTYMAAESLERAAAKAGVDIHVETQGSAGATPLHAATIANASAVIFACDVGVRDRSRFAGLPMVSSGVKRAIDDPDGMIADALRYAEDPGAPRVEGTAGDAAADATHGGESWGGRARRILMTGVSYMIPFVAAGGLLIALGFLFAGYEVAKDGIGSDIVANNGLFDLPDLDELGLSHALFNSPLMAYLGSLMFVLGGAAFGFLVPALSGYIAFAIADRPGLAPGFVMGAVALIVNSGFLGGIVGGVLAGIVAHWIAGWKVPKWSRGLMPVLVIPLLTTLVVGFVMIVVLGKPLNNLMKNLNDGLNSMSGGSIILLGVVLGLMMAFDMGGPLNKVAYAFATTGLATAATQTGAPTELKVMAAVMLAGMVPPLALALATVVRPGLFSPAEKENGKAAWALGASFITEGAIPFAAADPFRVIPSIMAGSALTGALAMGMGVTLRAPHGGIFVLFAVDNVLGFFIALVAGVLLAAGLVLVLKSMGTSDADIATV